MNYSNNLSFQANDDLSELLCGDTLSLIGCIVEVSAEDENGESVDDIIPTLTLQEVASCVELPKENWYVRIETSSLHFFEIDVISTARPVVSRSVTFNHDLCNPVIHIDGVNVCLPCTSSLLSVDDVSNLLLSVSAMQPHFSDHFVQAVDLLDRIIVHLEADNVAAHCSPRDNNEENVLESVPDHIYTLAGQSNDTVVSEIPMACIRFTRHQLQLLSVSCSKRRRYNPALIRWCLMVNFHSPAAYRAICCYQVNVY